MAQNQKGDPDTEGNEYADTPYKAHAGVKSPDPAVAVNGDMSCRVVIVVRLQR